MEACHAKNRELDDLDNIDGDRGVRDARGGGGGPRLSEMTLSDTDRVTL